ncbi:tetratricopeptide repeat protein [Marinobacter psychrophilus]|uniref:tetratricopeptide repeat protein n=1 Tax=Marinobacter psychrophilus TaxID=330734 RepID=UPI001B73253D|nr:hypothetical protein [Marinobacter psychrophilus]MBQ0763591.1 sel1 repeat family protein [Marinobacter psychrophilus]MBQ0845350.1 sel1 repeat family protein [Marinobacter psychrophilus]
MPNTLLKFQIWMLLTLIISVSSAWPQTKPNQAEILFREGYILYQQRYSPNAFTKFKEAASLGHAEAAYYAGNIIRRNFTFITEEAADFYRQAADGGDIYAMLRFAQKGKMCGTLRNCNYDRQKWIDRAKETALPESKAGDTQAMMAVSIAYGLDGDLGEEFGWVKKAAEHGHAFAQYWLATGLLGDQKMGFYWTEASRRKDVLKWLRASAEQGFAKAIENLAVEYYKDGRFEDCHEWVDRMGQTDYFDALYNYGLVLMDGPEGMYRYPETRSVDGLATLLALHRQTGSSAVQRSIDRRLPDLDPKIVDTARARSEKLLVDTPILHYLPKFGI